VDTFAGGRQRPVILGPEILVGFQVGPQFPAQTLVIIKPHQDLSAFLGAVEDALQICAGLILVRQRGEHGDDQSPIDPISNRVAVTQAVKREIHPVGHVTILPLASEHILKNELAQQLRFFTAAEVDGLDFSADVPLFVGEKEVVVTTAADECFPFEPLQAFFDMPTQGQAVRIDLIQAERDKVIDVALHFLDVADQEEHLQELHVERLQARVVMGLIDGPLDGGVQEALDRGIKLIQWH
jgi:hypothetical protein